MSWWWDKHTLTAQAEEGKLTVMSFGVCSCVWESSHLLGWCEGGKQTHIRGLRSHHLLMSNACEANRGLTGSTGNNSVWFVFVSLRGTMVEALCVTLTGREKHWNTFQAFYLVMWEWWRSILRLTVTETENIRCCENIFASFLISYI